MGHRGACYDYVKLFELVHDVCKVKPCADIE